MSREESTAGDLLTWLAGQAEIGQLIARSLDMQQSPEERDAARIAALKIPGGKAAFARAVVALEPRPEPRAKRPKRKR